MLLLSADTSGKDGSIALARTGKSGVEVLETLPLAGGTFSTQFIPQVATLLARHDLAKSDIDGFVVASGPGSFTGLRVGLAAIKGLAEILGKPIAAVSLLEALALCGSAQGRVVAVLDAGRGEVYIGQYEIDSGNATMIEERLLAQAELFAEAWETPLVTSDQNLAAAAKAAGLAVSLVETPDAGSIASLGWKKLQRDEVVSSADLEVNYLGRKDSEIFAKSRIKTVTERSPST